nr:sulfatase-like hydrolase/transferase [Mesorhizobium sp.]
MARRAPHQHVGLTVDELKGQGLFDDTIIVMGADHGENLGELNVWGDHQASTSSPAAYRWSSAGPGADDMRGVNRGLHDHFDWAPR